MLKYLYALYATLWMFAISWIFVYPAYKKMRGRRVFDGRHIYSLVLSCSALAINIITFIIKQLIE